jgi:C_GCAxxG_C_C family probable redox protein
MNCAQAVFETYADEMGIPPEMAKRIATAFAGGMCVGHECGAVTGALMVIGTKYGPSFKDTEKPAKEFLRAFRARHKSTGCSHLLKIDMATPEGVRDAAERGLFTSHCPEFVRSATEILDEMLGC